MQHVNSFEFRPEASAPVFVDGIRSLMIWRDDIQEATPAISLARLKKGRFADGSGNVLIPDDDEHLRKIIWSARDMGPTISGGRIIAGSVVNATTNGQRHLFLRAAAPTGKSTEMLWRINTGKWGDADEVMRIEGIMRGGKFDAPPTPLFHTCVALEGGEGEELIFAEHAERKSTHGYLVSKDLKIGRWDDTVLWNGQKIRVAARRTYLWRNFDGFKLATLGCIPDSGYILINDKGSKREERPVDQKKFRERIEEKAWNDREAAFAKRKTATQAND